MLWAKEVTQIVKETRWRRCISLPVDWVDSGELMLLAKFLVIEHFFDHALKGQRWHGVQTVIRVRRFATSMHRAAIIMWSNYNFRKASQSYIWEGGGRVLLQLKQVQKNPSSNVCLSDARLPHTQPMVMSDAADAYFCIWVRAFA